MFWSPCFIQKKAATRPTQEAAPKEEEEIIHEDNEWGRKPSCTLLLGGSTRLHKIADNSYSAF